MEENVRLFSANRDVRSRALRDRIRGRGDILTLLVFGERLFAIGLGSLSCQIHRNHRGAEHTVSLPRLALGTTIYVTSVTPGAVINKQTVGSFTACIDSSS